MNKSFGKLYLIPNFLGDNRVEENFPANNIEIVKQIRHFFVETIKPARQLLKKMIPEINLDAVEFLAHDKHNRNEGLDAEKEFIARLLSGNPGGLISDSGCPAIADPGNRVIMNAHLSGIEVIPLIGPSSILLTLIASGLNGQNFSFKGYLPKEKTERIQKLKEFSTKIRSTGCTFLFIETPYRVGHVIEDLLQNMADDVVLCVAADLMSNRQQIISRPIRTWKKNHGWKNFNGRLVVLAVGRGELVIGDW